MKKSILIFSLLSVFNYNSNAQHVAGYTAAGAHVIYLGDRIEAGDNYTTVEKDFDLNCDGQPDIQLKLSKGFSAVDMPNTLEMVVLDSTLKFAVDTSNLSEKKVKYYKMMDTLTNDGSYVWSGGKLLIGNYGCITCDNNGNYSGLYIWYKKRLSNTSTETGWINLEFDLNDSDNSIYPNNPDGSSSYPVSALLYRAMVYGDVDFVAKDSMVEIKVDTLRSKLDIKYTIGNVGNSCSPDLYTLFYLSNDSIFDSSDTLSVASSIDRTVPAMGTITNSVTLYINQPFPQKVMYVFYRVNDVYVWPPNYTGELPFDVDFQQKKFETDSTNNIGSFKLIMSDSLVVDLTTYIPPGPVIEDTIPGFPIPVETVTTTTGITSVNEEEIQKVYVFESTLFVEINSNQNAGNYLLNIVSMTGEKVCSLNVNINKGTNKITLPESLADGIYIVSFTNNTNSITQKIALIK